MSATLLYAPGHFGVDFSGSMLAFGVEIFGPGSIFGVAGVENFGPKKWVCHRFREKKVVFLRGVGVPRIFGPKKRNLGSHEGGYVEAIFGVPGPDFGSGGSSRASARRSRPFLGSRSRRFDPRTGPERPVEEKKSGRIAAECLRLFVRHFKSCCKKLGLQNSQNYSFLVFFQYIVHYYSLYCEKMTKMSLPS